MSGGYRGRRAGRSEIVRTNRIEGEGLGFTILCVIDLGPRRTVNDDVGGAGGAQGRHHRASISNVEFLAINGYNLSVSAYVQPEDTTEAIDITALNARIAEIVARQSELRTQIDAIVADLEGPS